MLQHANTLRYSPSNDYVQLKGKPTALYEKR